jgi:DNA-binding PadR family transcriptional regulator
MASRGMTQTAFFVLVALTDEPRHGYGIVQEVDALSGGRVQLRIGTLYGVLDRLAADELIELDREEAHQGRLRRYYRLTDAGEAALSEEAERMADGARTAARRVEGRRGGASAGNPGGATEKPASSPPHGSVRPGLAGGGA